MVIIFCHVILGVGQDKPSKRPDTYTIQGSYVVNPVDGIKGYYICWNALFADVEDELRRRGITLPSEISEDPYLTIKYLRQKYQEIKDGTATD